MCPVGQDRRKETIVRGLPWLLGQVYCSPAPPMASLDCAVRCFANN